MNAYGQKDDTTTLSVVFLRCGISRVLIRPEDMDGEGEWLAKSQISGLDEEHMVTGSIEDVELPTWLCRKFGWIEG